MARQYPEPMITSVKITMNLVTVITTNHGILHKGDGRILYLLTPLSTQLRQWFVAKPWDPRRDVSH
jgi:hypothetical protein